MAIHNEAEAFQLLEQSIRGAVEDDFQLEFDGWPIIRFTVRGDDWDQTITPTAMQAFIDLQNAIYRTVATVKYGEPNTRRLTKEEREDFEVRVRVDSGSSEFVVDLQAMLEKMVELGVERMTGTQIVITVLGLATIAGGVSAIRKFLDDRRQERIEKSKDDVMRAQLNTMNVLGQQDTRRWQIITQAMRLQPGLEMVEESIHNMRTQMLKTAADSEGAELDGLQLEPDIARELAINARRESTEERLDGVYRVEKVDSTDPLRFKVTIRRVETDQRFIALIQDDADRNHKRLIQDAEWRRQEIFLHINAKVVGGEVRAATIIGAQEREQ